MSRHYSYIDDSVAIGASTLAFLGTQNGYTNYGCNISTTIRPDILQVVETSTFTGEVDINGGGKANTFKVEDLTNNRVVIAGTGGEIEDDANLTYDGVGLIVGAGSGVTASNTGNIAATGIVTAATLKCNTTTDGFYPPLVTTTQRNAMTVNAGAIVFNTTTAVFNVYNGSNWQAITVSSA